MARSTSIKLEDIFPHRCRIYRIIGEDEFTEGTVHVIYDGICRDEGNTAMRTYTTNGVMKADHAIQIPKLLVGVTNECRVDITNDCVKLKNLQITNCLPYRYGRNRRGIEQAGTTVMYNEVKN